MPNYFVIAISLYCFKNYKQNLRWTEKNSMADAEVHSLKLYSTGYTEWAADLN